MLYDKNLNLIMQRLIGRGPANDVFNCSDSVVYWRDIIREYCRLANLELPRRKRPFLSVMAHMHDQPYQLRLSFSRMGGHFPSHKLSAYLDGLPVEYAWQQAIAASTRRFLQQQDQERAGAATG